MSSAVEDLERELVDALRKAGQDASTARGVIQSVRERALAAGHLRLAAGCLKALAVVMPTEEWVDLHAGALIAEESTSASYMARATAFTELGRREEAWRDNLFALGLEGADGDREICELCIAGLQKLLGSD
jgi:hypothetical protein